MTLERSPLNLSHLALIRVPWVELLWHVRDEWSVYSRALLPVPSILVGSPARESREVLNARLESVFCRICIDIADFLQYGGNGEYWS